ncbi:MAG: mevalonate kinase [Promethearchaeota archaeon]
MNYSMASAPGKCILFGEHAVVYGFPALSMAIDILSYCKISEIDQNGIFLHLENYNYNEKFADINDLYSKIPQKFKQIALGIKLISEKYKIIIDKIKIKISSELWAESGLGSSASSSIALLGALNDFYKLNLEKEDISNLAFEMEKHVHGKPSGIDNTTCSRGGLIFYENHDFQRFEFLNQFKILIIYTGKTHDTKEAIENVKKFCDEEPKLSRELFNKIKIVTKKGFDNLKKGNMIEIGNLMNLNQQILNQLRLSTADIEKIVNISNSNNAYGSKLTGAGMGGCVISIGEITDLEIIQKKLKIEGFDSIITSINNQGVAYGR